MTQKEALKLQVGTIAILSQNDNVLVELGLNSSAFRGKEIGITQVEHGNDRYYFKIANNNSVYECTAAMIASIKKGKAKPKKFGKAEIETFIKEGSNTRLTTERNSRINEARICIANAAGALFNESTKQAKELIRQAELINRAIRA